jgi:hypothetical protein
MTMFEPDNSPYPRRHTRTFGADHQMAALVPQQRRRAIDPIACDLDRIGGRLERIAADLKKCRRLPD